MASTTSSMTNNQHQYTQNPNKNIQLCTCHGPVHSFNRYQNNKITSELSNSHDSH